MRIQDIDIDLIDIGKGRRVADPAWQDAIAADMSRNGQIEPIEVVEAGDRFRLIDGLHRIGARKIRGEVFIAAKIKTAAEVASEAQIVLREIAANFMRRELSVLDKARDVARWREVYEQTTGSIKPGKRAIRVKSDPNSDEEIEAQSELFSASFSDASQAALGLNKEAVKRYLRIARIDDAVRQRISLHRMANNQSELLALCVETADRQAQIAGLLLAEPPAAHTVVDAISIIDRIPPVEKPQAWERVSDKFSKLPDPAKRRFLIEHWELIEAILAERKAA
jgi:ParB family transcriptional regulator, chromosome partitioning protein